MHKQLPQIMGILNLTPDSFYSSSRISPDVIRQKAAQMIADGASILDLGGESTRPGAKPVGLHEEMARVLPALELLRSEFDVTLSIDTQKPELMLEAIKLGADFINDVNGLQAPGALEIVAEGDVDICVMHIAGNPETMQDEPYYDEDIVTAVSKYFEGRLAACEQLGINRSKVFLDPGIGFGKNLAHNLRLINQIKQFKQLGCGLLLGVSRKSMFGQILNKPAEERLYGSLAVAALASLNRVDILRVHDVAATMDVIKVVAAVSQEDWHE